ncbi:MAG TPA: alpha-glucosidase C-terminal domain-containing protein, partial [Pseudomonadales bacterium]|nr:alpha-glucosidase C-terminal domain-containing protein [Pseudomonadales bacterium]
ASQEHDPASPLNYFRRMAKLRSESLTLIYGAYELLLPEHDSLYVFTRTLDNETLLVALNFSTDEQNLIVDDVERVLINNYDDLMLSDGYLTLMGWQAVVLKLA